MKKPLIAFAVLLAIPVLADVLRRFGTIDAFGEKRAIGLALGAMAIVVGNYLPKMRIFASARLLGWILVAAGCAYVALFVVAPLALARQAAAIIGVAVIVIGAILWQPVRADANRRAVAIVLTFLYLLSTAIVVYVFGNAHWTEWLHGAFFVGYFTLYAIGEQRCLRN
jgi:hypothetical protein